VADCFSVTSTVFKTAMDFKFTIISFLSALLNSIVSALKLIIVVISFAGNESGKAIVNSPFSLLVVFTVVFNQYITAQGIASF